MKPTLTRLSAALLLVACASQPAPPDWQSNAFTSLNNYTAAYLEGNTRVADFEFARAKSEVARTGRLNLMTRIELVRCAILVASLALEPCTGYLALADDALPPERSYAAFIAGEWSDIDLTQLATPYRAVVMQTLENSAQAARSTPATPLLPSSHLSQIEDPLARLIAAGSLLKRELLTNEDIGLAVDSASEKGWRRPLLAWLTVWQKRAQDASDNAAAAQLQRRIDLVLQTPTR